MAKYVLEEQFGDTVTPNQKNDYRSDEFDVHTKPLARWETIRS